MTMEKGPKFNVNADRTLINTDGGSVRFIVAEIHAPKMEAAPKDRHPLNLATVIDASGSMSGMPIAAAKSATVGVIGALEEVDRLSVVSFATDTIVHCDAILQNIAGKSLAIARTDEIQCRGSTDLASGWFSGCECVARVMQDNPKLRNRVIVLSDGHANHGITDPSSLERHASELRARGIMTSTIGIGTGYSPTQLQAIAEHGGGRMHDAETPAEIIEIVKAELEDLSMTVMDNTEIELVLPAGAVAETVGNMPFRIEPTGIRALTGAVLSGATRRVVFKVTFPAGAIDSGTHVQAKLRWTTPGDSNQLSLDSAPVNFVYADAQRCLQQPRNIELSIEIAMIWKMAIVRRTMVLNTDGQFEQAERYAQEELRWFHRYCHGLPGVDADIIELGRMARHAQHRFSPMQAKEVMLAAYKSGRGEIDRRSVKRQHWADNMPE
jgi:Ca-activated chloride channel family protein